MTPARQPSAAILKLSGDVHGWRGVVLRETNFVDGAYLVKVDGVSNENNKKEQIQILFTERDAADLSYTLEIHLLKRESGKQALKLTRDIHAINTHTSTPAPEPDEKCYIIMESEIGDALENAMDLKKMHGLVEVVMSRQHPPASEHTATFPCDIPCDTPEDCTLVKEAAKAAREQVLDALTPPHVNQFKGLIDGWKVDSKFLKEIKDALDNPDEWSIDMEEIEVVLIAVQKVLRAQQQGGVSE